MRDVFAKWNRHFQKGLFFLAAVAVAFSILQTAPVAYASTPVLKVGYTDSDGIFVDENGDYSGYAVDYLKELSKYTGWKYEFVFGSGENCLDALERGEIDLMPMMIHTPERAEKFLYSALDVQSCYTVLYAESDSDIYYQDYDAFDGCRIGVAIDSYFEISLQEHLNRLASSGEVITFPTEHEAKEALLGGEIDLIAASSFSSYPELKVVDRFAMVPCYIITGKQNEELMEQINAAIPKLRIAQPDLEYRLNEAYRDTTKVDALLTREEQMYLDSLGPVLVKGSENHKPMFYVGEDTGLRGILVDYLDYLGTILGIEFVYETADSAALADNAAVMAGEEYLFLGIRHPLISTEAFPAIHQSDNLADTTLAYVRRQGEYVTKYDKHTFALHQEMEYLEPLFLETNSESEILYFEDSEDCMKAVLDGSAEMAIIEEHEAAYWLQKPIYQEKLTQVAGSGAYAGGMCLYAPEQYRQLIPILDRAMARVSETQKAYRMNASAQSHSYEYQTEDILQEYGSAIIVSCIFLFVLLILAVALRQNRKEKIEAKALRHRLQTDELTGTFSREYFLEKAGEMIRSEAGAWYIVRLNICRFKLINEFRGIEKGDQLLKSIGKDLLEKRKEYRFIVGRFAADQFYLCIRQKEFECFEIPKRVSVAWLNMDIAITYGVCPVEEGTPVNVMCDRADMALSSDGRQVLENVYFYDENFHQQLLREQEIENEMEAALAEGQFVNYIQPKYDVDTEQVAGGEVLVRWNHPQKGIIPPTAFISVFEKNGFILPLDYYVWEESCRFLAELKKKGILQHPLSVNVSRLHFYSGELQSRLVGLVEKYQLDPKELELEITESIYAEDPEIIIEQCGQLRALGFRISMDDFGSGFSSLNMLQQMPLDIIKMDLKFLAGNEADEHAGKSRDILRTQIELAHTIGLDVVVEGLETKTQKDFIREVGNCAAQGYYFARPMPASEFAELIQSADGESVTAPASGMAAAIRRERLRREQLQPQLELIFEAENLFGYLLPEKEAVLPKHLAQTLHCPERVPNLGEYLVSSGALTPASAPRCMQLAEAMERGDRSGATIIEFVDDKGNVRPYWVRFSMLQDFEGNPLIAMVSIADFGDISEQVELLMASRKAQAEAENLQLKEQVEETKRIFQIVSEHSNRILYIYDLASGTTKPWDEENEKKDILAHLYTGTYSEEGLDQNKAIISEHRDDIKQFFTDIHSGVPSGELNIHVRLADGEPKWYHFKYSSIFHHGEPVSAVISVEDITEEKTAQMNMQLRLERDGMTDLYNRDTAETLIREKIRGNASRGILVAVDLDRLKKINDNYGHDEGDKAIVSIAQILRAHFRDSDIIGRYGGDEFVIYMPGAAKNREVIAGTIAELMRKLESLSVGKDEEMGITCSIGCVVQQEDSTYESLFKQADRALYHVKKSGRGNFAFYSPEMEDDGFVYHVDKLFSLDHAKHYETGEVRELLTVLCDIYHVVVAFNITENTYHMMQESKGSIFSQRPTHGEMDALIEISEMRMPPEDAERFEKAVSRQALIEADARGKKHVSVQFLTRDINDTYRLAECNSILYRNAKGDLCEFALIGWV